MTDPTPAQHRPQQPTPTDHGPWGTGAAAPARPWWPPPPPAPAAAGGGHQGLPGGGSGGPTSGTPSRAVVIIAAVLAVLVVTGLAVLTIQGRFGRGSGEAAGGRAAGPAAASRSASGSSEHGVAARFVALEDRRWNAASQAPDPTRADYQAVSCQADLKQMAAGSTPLPPVSAKPRYQFTLDRIESGDGPGGHDVLIIDRTDNTSGEVDHGVFEMLREQGGSWRVCGMFPSTEIPIPSQDQANPGASPSHVPGGGQAERGDQDAQAMLDQFGQAVHAGNVATLATYICVDAPAVDPAVLGWTSQHATVTSHVADMSQLGGTASVSVTVPGQAPQTANLLLRKENGKWCIANVN